MAIARIGTGKTGAGRNSVTTATGYNTTGATLLVAGVSTLVGTTVPSISDSKSNSGWVKLTTYGSVANQAAVTWFYCISPTSLGADHTVTLTATDLFAALAFFAYSGTDSSSYDTVTGANVAPPANYSEQPGSITPAAADELMLVMAGLYTGTGSVTADSSFSLALEVAAAGGSNYSGHWFEKIKTGGSTSAENPTVDFGVFGDGGGVSMIAFKPAGGGGSSSLPPIQRLYRQRRL